MLKTAAQGTDAYANAQRRIPQLQDDIARQAFSISATYRKRRWAPPAPRGSWPAPPAGPGSALRSLTTFGLAAGAGIAVGVGAGAATLLTKNAELVGARSAAAADPFHARRGRPPQLPASCQHTSCTILTGRRRHSAARQCRRVADCGPARARGPRIRPRAISLNAHGRSPALSFNSAREFEQATSERGRLYRAHGWGARGSNRDPAGLHRVASQRGRRH